MKKEEGVKRRKMMTQKRGDKVGGEKQYDNRAKMESVGRNGREK